MGNISQQKGFNSGMQIYLNIVNKSLYFIVLTGGKKVNIVKCTTDSW